MNSPTYFLHVKTKILADFQVCISVPYSRAIGSNILMTFALFNQSEERKLTSKKGFAKKKIGVTGAKANIHKGNI